MPSFDTVQRLANAASGSPLSSKRTKPSNNCNCTFASGDVLDLAGSNVDGSCSNTYRIVCSSTILGPLVYPKTSNSILTPKASTTSLSNLRLSIMVMHPLQIFS